MIYGGKLPSEAECSRISLITHWQARTHNTRKGHGERIFLILFLSEIVSEDVLRAQEHLG